MDKTFVKSRKWVRSNTGWGDKTSVHTKVSLEEYKRNDGEYSRCLFGDFGMRDCSNYASIDLNAESDKHWRIHKQAIDVLLTEVTKLRDAWVAGREEVIKRGGWESK